MHLFQCPDIKIAKKFFFENIFLTPTWNSRGIKECAMRNAWPGNFVEKFDKHAWYCSKYFGIRPHWSHGDWKEISQSISGHTSWSPHLTVHQDVLRGIFFWCIRAIRHQSNAGYTSKLITYYIIARNEYLCANIIVINSENRRNHRHLGRFQVKFNFLLACVSRQGQYI